MKSYLSVTRKNENKKSSIAWVDLSLGKCFNYHQVNKQQNKSGGVVGGQQLHETGRATVPPGVLMQENNYVPFSN